MTYIHELTDWPRFTWDKAKLSSQLVAVRHRQGKLLGRMEGLGFDLRNEAMLRTLTSDVVKSSEIEGETLDKDQVRSSIAKRLGLEIGGLIPSDRHVDGVVEMMLDATQAYDQPLDAERLFGWHAALFPTGRSGMTRITVGQWRIGPMEVVSGPMGRERVHFEAPEAARLDTEMGQFLAWFNQAPTRIPLFMPQLHICGSSRSTPLTMATGALRVRSRIWRWRDPNAVHNGFTACLPKSGRSGMPIIICSRRRRRAGLMSQLGSVGS